VRLRTQHARAAENRGKAATRSELVESVFDLADAALPASGAIVDIGRRTGWWLAEFACDDRVSASLHRVELLPERVLALATRVPEARIE
jgi:hypothetical protein